MGITVAGRRRGRSRRQTFAEINITPLTDVVLVLLIIFMVTAQFIGTTERGLTVNLPAAGQVEDLDTLGGIKVAVDRSGQMTVDSLPSTPATLENDLRAVMKSPQQLVIVEGDRETILQSIVTVMDAAAGAGLPNVVLATAPEAVLGAPQPAPAAPATPPAATVPPQPAATAP
ncbi:MAG: biopolymer transporter ExbD [Armatimonadetes bacterium]|nr:biopolymer transporter ExbD [Armatimonadota bacterium]